ncbi:MAG: efflux RND transporter permease subunit [Planctomycetaceae bacterium]
MAGSFLSRRTRFGVSGALLILLIFFFLLPSAFRGARLAIASKKNDIKDWLPSDFRETVELAWFAKYFIGESFVVATWDGCTPGDQRLNLLANKLERESAERDLSTAPADVARARELAEKLQLFLEPAELNNWGGLNEKWFATPSGRYYFITPDGRFYRWDDESNAVGGLFRAAERRLGTYELKGQFVVALGEPSTKEKTNAYYNDPTLLAASLFQSVQTGSELVEELSREGGPLWPVDLTDASQRSEIAETRAIERLTGTLFAPAVPEDFEWTPEAVLENIPPSMHQDLPTDFDQRVRSAVQAIEDRMASARTSLKDTTTEQRDAAWAELCSAIGIPVPPRQTCVLVTLTPLGKEHLARSIGRGVLGAPRGRLLILADQSGVAAAPPPSMAPPPFDHPEDQVRSASGRAMLRIGGPPVDNVAIDEEGTVTLIRLVGYSGLVGIALSFLCFRSIKLTIMIFMVGLSSAVLGLAITYWAGGHVDAILMTMPSMVYISGLSGAIHIVNYCRDEAHERGSEGAIMRAVKHAWGPAFLCSFTTALGLFSLCTSNLVPIRNFGLYTGIAVMTMLAVLFTYMPAALTAFPPSFLTNLGRKKTKSKGRLADERPAAAAMVQTNWVSELWATVGRWITGHHAFVSIACSIVLIVSCAGVFRINTTVQLLKLFDEESRIISDYGYLENNFGKLVPMEVVVRVPPAMVAENRSTEDDVAGAGALPTDAAVASNAAANPAAHPLTVLERVEAVGRIDTVARRALGEGGTGVIGKTMSAVTFLPPLPEASSGYSLVRARFQNRLNASLATLEETDCYRVENGGPRNGSELWRISLRVGALSNVDYGQFVGDLRLAVTPVLDAYRARSMILSALQDTEANKNPRKLPSILFIGHREPKSLDTEKLIDPSLNEAGDAAGVADIKSLIQTKTIYAATIAELMANEKVRRPVWIDLDSPDAKLKPGDERWDKLISAVDCVVLLDGQTGVDAAALAKNAKRFVDVRLATMPVAEPTLDGAIPIDANAGPLEAIYTGIVPVVYKAQRTLLQSLIVSTIMASVSIALTMAFLMIPGYLPGALFRPKTLYYGLMAGSVAMIPNMFPIVMVFGIMGHANILVDIGTMMTASVALGIAVDDTIHFLSWFRQYIDEGMSRVEAVIETYRRVGPAMMQTAFVGGLGMFVFALSTFTPTQRFGTLMLVLLMTALLGDLILLPALLAGPLGRWFRPRGPVPVKTIPVTTHPYEGEAALVSGNGQPAADAAELVGIHNGSNRTAAPKGLHGQRSATTPADN